MNLDLCPEPAPLIPGWKKIRPQKLNKLSFWVFWNNQESGWMLKPVSDGMKLEHAAEPGYKPGR
jgi:hypothetical protein